MPHLCTNNLYVYRALHALRSDEPIMFVVQSLTCVWFCDPMDCSMPGFPVLQYLPEFAQTHVHWVGDTMQPSHPLLLPSPESFPPSGSFPVSCLSASGGQIGASASGSLLAMNIHCWFPLGLTGLILLSKGLSKVFFSTTSSLDPYKRCVVYRGAIIPVFQLRKWRPRIK